MPACPKYRPSLTLAELKAVVSAVRELHPETRLNKYLERFLWETENGLKTPAHVTQASKIEVKLGLDVHRFPEHFMAKKIPPHEVKGHWEYDLFNGTNESGKNPKNLSWDKNFDEAVALASSLKAASPSL